MSSPVSATPQLTVLADQGTVAEGQYASFRIRVDVPPGGERDRVLTLFTAGLAGADDVASGIEVLWRGPNDPAPVWTRLDDIPELLVTGSTELQVRVLTAADGVVEGPESLSLSVLLEDTGGSETALEASASLDIVDAGGLAVAGLRTPESAGYVEWSVAIPGSTRGGASVLTLSARPDTAEQGVDYSSALVASVDGGRTWVAVAGGQVAVPAGTEQVLVRAAVIDDTRVEADETVVLDAALSAGGVGLGSGSAAATIADDDLPRLTVTGNTVPETSGERLAWTIDLAGPMPESGLLKLSVVAVPGIPNATVGEDYSREMIVQLWAGDRVVASALRPVIGADGSAEVAVPEGVTRVVVLRTPVEDGLDEPVEVAALRATLTAPDRVDTSAQGRAYLYDEIPPARFSVADTTVVEGESGTAMVAVTITRGGNPDIEASVSWTTLDGSALDGQDYLASSGRVTFAAGETSKTVLVPIVGDRISELHESFGILLSLPSGNALIDDEDAVVTVRDTDLPLFTVTGNAVVEDSGSTLEWRIAFDGGRPTAVDARMTLTVGGTAARGVDYEDTFKVSVDGGRTWQVVSGASPSFGVPAGATGVIVQANVRGDGVWEYDETVTLDASLSATERVTTTGTGTSTILDNDLPDMTVTGNRVSEGANSPLQWEVRFEGSGAIPPSNTMTLTFGGGAARALDYLQAV